MEIALYQGLFLSTSARQYLFHAIITIVLQEIRISSIFIVSRSFFSPLLFLYTALVLSPYIKSAQNANNIGVI